MKQKFQVTSLLISIVLAELVGALSALFSGNIGSGYQGLNQPPLWLRQDGYSRRHGESCMR